MAKPSVTHVANLLQSGTSTTDAAVELRNSGYKFSDKWLRSVILEQLAAEMGLAHAPAANDNVEPAKPLFGGTVFAPDQGRKELAGKRFVFTVAQNNTKLHDDFWLALQKFCEVNEAQLGVSKISYNKNGWQRLTTDSETDGTGEDIWYDERIVPYIINEQVRVAKGLLFCGELDILPTAASPLQGLDSYTGPNSAIIPHTKLHMKSLATMKHDEPKFMFTTGAVTLRNYIDRRAGQVATFHHVYAAMYVEVNEAGEWFARQLVANEAGEFFDLDMAYGPGWAVPASDLGRPHITLGDIHVEKLDETAWAGASAMLADLNPDKVFVHDIIDFEARNHHNKMDPVFLVNQAFNRNDSVQAGIQQAAGFLYGLIMYHPDMDIYVIRSNHDEAIERWLKEGSGYPDPKNQRYWHELNAKWLGEIEKGNSRFDIIEYAISSELAKLDQEWDQTVHFIKADESLVFRDIEHGMHGHLGPRGARGTPAALRQIGRKANTAHTHSPGIIDGLWTAGQLAVLDMGYNRGPGSNSHSSILTHPNGKRQMITQRGERYRA